MAVTAGILEKAPDKIKEALWQHFPDEARLIIRQAEGAGRMAEEMAAEAHLSGPDRLVLLLAVWCKALCSRSLSDLGVFDQIFCHINKISD